MNKRFATTPSSRTHLFGNIFSIIALLFFITYNNGSFNNAVLAREYYSPYSLPPINRVLAKPLDYSPLEFSADDNFAIAAAVICDSKLTKSYKSVTSGKIVANIFNYTQNVKNTKIVENNKIFTESISLSTFASVAEQKYFDGENILLRKAKTKGKKIISWQNIVNIKESFTQNYGAIPRELTKYSVTKQSYLRGEFVGKNSIGTYVYKMELDSTLCQKYACKEMMTFANVKKEPIFYKTTLTFAIDSEWKILYIVYDDYYKIDLLGGIKCRSTLTETFEYPAVLPNVFKDFL